MRRWWTILLTLALILMGSSTVLANGGPHGGYTATTDACAGCHRAHTATGPRLLVQSSTHQLCLSCHGAGVTGANTNVVDGLYLSARGGDTTSTPDNAPLRGGGFSAYLGRTTSSTHVYDGSTDQAWGAGGFRGQLGAIDAPLTCASCHDPHGSPNYRIIKATVNGVSVTVTAVDETNKNYAYDTTDSDNDGSLYPADPDDPLDGFAWPSDYSNLCGACHDPYLHPANYPLDTTYTHTVAQVFTGSPRYTDANGNTVAVPLSTAAPDIIVCGTCHLPHGTSAQMSGYAADAGPAKSSALLRWDNRGVCQACHKKP